jgi:23S rRNA maturation-related 3'-5' exoribonuclease YhaM
MPKNELLDGLIAASEEQITSTQELEDTVLAPLLEIIDLIQNAYLRSFVRCVLYNTPEEFWTMPVSTLPDIHPPDEYAEGGLVLHTKRVVRAAALIAEVQLRIQEDIDVLVAAALLHDIVKADESIPDYLHSIAVDKFVENLSVIDELDADYVTRSNTLSFIMNHPDQLILLMRVIRAHEGLDSPCPELVPVTSLEQILNIANQIAKNIDKIVDGYEIQEFRWRTQEAGSTTEDSEAQGSTGKD